MSTAEAFRAMIKQTMWELKMQHISILQTKRIVFSTTGDERDAHRFVWAGKLASYTRMRRKLDALDRLLWEAELRELFGE